MMERLKASHAKSLPELFSKVDEFLTKTLYTKDTITPALIEKVEAGLTEIYKEFGEDFKGSMVDVFIDSYKFEHESIAGAYGATAGNLTAATAEAILVTKTLADVPSDNKLRKVYQDYIDSKPLLMEGQRGKHFAKVIDDFSQAEAELVSNALRAGHFEGKTVQELKQQIRGTRKNGFRDGILQASSRHAEAIVRTGLQQAACDAREEFAQANDDLIEGVQILATLDSRTTTICRSLDHMVLPLSDPRRPPFHVNCRSTFIFVLKEQYRGKDIKGKRASMNGYVENDSYYEWLKSQPESFQNTVLGAKRAKLFRDGGLSAKEFADLNLNKEFEPLTLEEMRALKPLAFERAGL